MEENASSEPAASTQGSSPNKNVLYIIAAVVLLVVIGGAYLFRHQIRTSLMPATPALQEISTAAPVPQPTQNEPAAASPSPTIGAIEVDYTASGFSPATVTIKKGSVVRFVNKSNNTMDVASDPHPTHTDYPGFDQYKSSQKGQNEYDFAFDKVGSWGYHNHLNPSQRGTVVVTE